jgi:O-antigen/teichoic acid export membrane protein
MQNEPSVLISLLPLILMSLLIAVGSYFLAKEKGRNALKWTILGAIPLVNFVCIWFFVGATNLRLERKLDQILAELKNRPSQ